MATTDRTKAEGINGRKYALVLLCGAFSACVSFAFEYDVRRPSDDLKPTFHAADTKPGAWTLAVDDAISKAKADGKYTILMNTASWWCPYCETAEELVLTSNMWKSYVAAHGFYLAVMDFPYRGHVGDDQVWKSWHPELGDGWGFKCWLMDPDYLAEIGLSADEGLAAIMSLYEHQADYALPTGDLITIKRWDTQEDFSYHKLGYLTLIVIGPDGVEAGRVGFPWWNTNSVTQREAQEYVIQAIERIIAGECEICQDETPSVVDVSKAHKYNGWMLDSEGVMSGSIEISTSKYNGSAKSVKARVKAVLGGKAVSFPTVEVPVSGCIVCGDESEIETVEVSKDGYRGSVHIGTDGLSGSFWHGDTAYTVKGGCNLFREKDAHAKALLATSPVGVWSLVLKNAEKDGLSPFSRGMGAISMDVRRTGVAKFTGTMGDGTRVSCSSQVILGSNGIACVPFAARLYNKKGGLSFVVWFKDGELLSVESVSKWVAAGKNPFEVAVAVQNTMSVGIGVVPDEMDFTIDDFPAEIGGMPLVGDQSADVVKASGKRWFGSELTGFKATVAGRTGFLNGSMTFLVRKDSGEVRPVRGTFKGIVMGGAGYGTVIVQNVGTWAVKIAACGSCND